MKITQDVREFAERGMAEKAAEFRAAGAEIYVETVPASVS
jgi:phosphomethylpyrimidine synthase